MKIKFGFISGFALGYYLGTGAGKERHVQLQRMVSKVKRSKPVNVAADGVKAAADTGVHKAKDKVSHKLHGNGLGETTEFMPS